MAMKHVHRLLRVGAAAAAGMLAAQGAMAEGLDGTSPLLCATQLAFECGPEGVCLTGDPGEFNVPKMISVDYTKMVATTIRVSGEQRQAVIANVLVTDTALLAQGFQGDVSWAAAIDRATGTLSLTGAGTGVSFSVFGVCGVL